MIQRSQSEFPSTVALEEKMPTRSKLFFSDSPKSKSQNAMQLQERLVCDPGDPNVMVFGFISMKVKA